MDWQALAAPFPKEAVHWRAQSVTRDGTKAMALAYIDARDVMRRLDDAVGPSNWQDEYTETAKGRVICRLTLYVDGKWITKSDGAGDTDVEGDKGALSDAFKRAAVKWGIGRYLYDMPAPWVPCESYEHQGRKRWRKWTADPWNFVKGGTSTSPPNPEAEALRERLITDTMVSLQSCTTMEELGASFQRAVALWKERGYGEFPIKLVGEKDRLKAVFSGDKKALFDVAHEPAA